MNITQDFKDAFKPTGVIVEEIISESISSGKLTAEADKIKFGRKLIATLEDDTGRLAKVDSVGSRLATIIKGISG